MCVDLCTRLQEWHEGYLCETRPLKQLISMSQKAMKTSPHLGPAELLASLLGASHLQPARMVPVEGGCLTGR